MRINKGVALSVGLLASVSLGIAQKPDTSQYLTKFTIQDLTQERRVRGIQNQKGGVMRRFKRAIGLMVFALSSISAQFFEVLSPYSKRPDLNQIS